MVAKQELVSPLLSRIQKQEPLTLKNLAHHIPRVRSAKASRIELESGAELSTAERQKHWRAVQEGEASKETLVLMALPLVNTIARNEYQRRSAWNSRVTLDDMIQEGLGGFLRGIEAYKVEGTQTSPTNYLGQWILSDIRRHVESLDHDFSIPHETIERHRKIRAIRSRLFNELGRYPTDDEILERANNRAHQPVNKMGKVNKESYVGKKMTQKNIIEEREYAASTGRLESITATDDENTEYEKKTNPLSGEDVPTSTHSIEENSAKRALSGFFEKVFKTMKLGKVQEEIVRQKFGLPPYKDEIPLAGISKNTQISKYKVNQVISAFATEMSSKGSIFHREVDLLGYDELDSLGLGWVHSTLGSYKQKHPNNVNPMLVQDMKPAPRQAKKRFGDPDRAFSPNYVAYYECDDGHQSSKGLITLRNKHRAMDKCETCGLPVIFVKDERSEAA